MLNRNLKSGNVVSEMFTCKVAFAMVAFRNGRSSVDHPNWARCILQEALLRICCVGAMILATGNRKRLGVDVYVLLPY